MLLALQTAISDLLQTVFPALFSGDGAVSIGYGDDTWSFDALSADPVAGEPGPEDAVDTLPLDAAAPAGPYALTRPPYPGPKRVYLRSAAGELVALLPGELAWNPADAASFTLRPRPGRDLAAFDHVEVHYGVIAAGTRLKTLHRLSVTLSAGDAAKAQQALALALAALALNRETLRRQAGFAFTAGGYETEGSLKALSFAGGSAVTGVPHVHQLLLAAEVELRVQRLLGADEGKPIARILSPGKAAGGRPVDIDPAVQA